MAMSIMAGAAFIKLTLNDASLNNGLEKAQKNITTFSQRVSAVFNNMSVLGDKAFTGFLTMAYPVGTAISAFSKFDDTLRTLKAISGANSQTMGKLETQIRNLGKTTAFSAAQVAAGGVELARMGLNADELKNAMPAALNLVRATGEETYRLGEISEFAAASLRIFNLNSSKFTDVTDVMAYAANRSAMGVSDLGEALKIAGPSAHVVGEDIRDASAALMLFANAGIKGSLAGTSLRKVYQSLAAVSGQTEGWTPEELEQGLRGKDQLLEMGIKVVDNNGNLRKAQDIMVDLADAVKRMKSGEKINFATDVFDLRGSLGALSMLSNPKDLKRFREELNNVGGYAKKTADEIEKGPGGQLRLLRSAIEELGLSFGGFMANNLMPFIKMLQGLSLALGALISKLGGFGTLLTEFSAGAMGAGLALWGIGTALRAVGSGFAPLLALVRWLDSYASGAKKAAKATEDMANAQKIADANKANIDKAENLVNKNSGKVAELQAELALQKAKDQTAAKEMLHAKAIVGVKERELATIQQVEAQKVAAVQNRVNQELAAEQQKLATIQAQHQKALANNEKARLAYTLQQGSSKGYKAIPEVAAAEKELKAQEKVIAAKEKAGLKAIATAEKESAVRIGAAEKELAARQKILATKTKELATASTNVNNTQNTLANATAAQAAAQKEYADATSQAATAEGVLSVANEKRAQTAKNTLSYVQKAISQGKYASGVSLRQAKIIKSLTFAQLRAGGASAFMALRLKFAANATLMLNRAMKFLAANPLLVAFSALSIVIQVVISKIQKMKEEFQKTLDKARELTEEAENATRKNEDKRNTAKDYFERAKQLAEISKQAELTAEQMAEAEFIAKELDPFGGKGWLNLDKNTKKLLLAADAAEEFKTGLQESAFYDVANEIKALEKEIDTLKYKKVDITKIIGAGPMGGGFSVKIGEKKVENKDLTDEQKKQLKIAEEKLVEARKRMMKEQVLASKKGYSAISGETKKYIDLKEKEAKLQDDLDRSGRSAYENKVNDIKKVRDEHKKYLEQLKEEARRLNKTDAVKMYDEKLKSIEAAYQKQLDDAKKEEEKRIAESRKNYEGFTSKFTEQEKVKDKREEQDRAIEGLLKNNAFDEALKVLNKFATAEKNIYVNMMKEYDKLEAEFLKATATEKQGFLNSEEQATLDKLKSAIQAAKDRERGFLSKVDQVKEQVADVQEKDLRHAVGGFNASSIARALLSSGGPDERTAKASEETNRILKKIERLQSKTSDYKTVYGE